MIRSLALPALLASLLTLTGCNLSQGADDAGRAGKTAAGGGKPIVDDIDNGASSLADDVDSLGAGADDTERAATPTAAERVHQVAVKAVAKGLLDIPEPTSAAGVQRDTLTDAVKDAGCDYLAEAITSGNLSDPSAFYDPLNANLADYGNPAQNQINAIQDSFGKLTGLLSGTTDAREAAKSIACAFIPG
jgi:hypothetical protein